MLVDTTFVVDLLRERRRGQHGPATATLAAHRSVKLRMPLFVRCELEAGARRAAFPERELQRIARLGDFIELVLPGPDFASRYGQTEAHLRAQGTMIPTMDLLIAALCIGVGEPLLTSDDHFRRIPHLVVVPFNR